MQKLIGLLILSLPVMLTGSDLTKTNTTKILPVQLDEQLIQDLGVAPGDDVWFEVIYRVSPGGKVLHQEWGERSWWIQDTWFLLLGATGESLPRSVTQRTTVSIEIRFDDQPIAGSPFEVLPRRLAVAIDGNRQSLKQALSKSTSIDASYLSQVTNFLAGNLTSLDVQGTSYAVMGYGSVIDETGHWTGESISSTVWSAETTPANFVRATPGGIASSEADLRGNMASTHINLGFGASVTGFDGTNPSYCTVGGGYDCSANGSYSTIAGGEGNNTIGRHSSIGGGKNNFTNNWFATVAGGNANAAWGTASTISGGENNATDNFYSSICGGLENIANGHGSIVSGGTENRAFGSYSWVSGRNMQLDSSANHTFVWGFSAVPQAISTPDAFLVFPKGTAGSLGVRTDDPAAPLHVAGGSDLNLSGGGYMITGSVTGRNIVYDENEIMARDNGSTTTLHLNASGGDVRVGGDFCATGAIATCSDRRYKQDISAITSPLAQLASIDGVRYRWNRDKYPDRGFSGAEQIGFIAQDLIDVVPQAVSQDDDGYYWVDYARLTPLLVEAVKALHNRVQELEASLGVNP